MTTSKLACLLLPALLVTACTVAAPDEPKSDAVDETTSAFGLRDITIAGSLAYGQTSAGTPYTKSPRYRAYKFAGTTGDEVEVWVKSSNGDPVMWLLDNDWHTVAKNDDAAPGVTSSHVKTKLPANASATHYIVVRDYHLDSMTFKVELQGGTADFAAGCTTDSDCVKVDKGCCSNSGQTAVVGSKVAAFTSSLACAAHTICPMFMLKPDYAAPECNQATKKCELVKPADIKCGGFIAPAMQHQCPAGYNCSHLAQGINPDVPGACVQFCGGIAAIQCHADNEECVDDPSDSCDVANGGADCGGVCHTKL